MEPSDCYQLDDSNLEPKVVYALSKLQKRKSLKRNGEGEEEGCTCKMIADFLKKHFSYLDGDIETQVTTALLSCVKTGIICFLKSGKYRLSGPYSKAMISFCLTRPSHGPSCQCIKKLKSLTKTHPNMCCTPNYSGVTSSGNNAKKIKKSSGLGQKNINKRKVRKKTTDMTDKKSTRSTSSNNRQVEKGKKKAEAKKCKTCKKVHSVTDFNKNLVKLCLKCNTPGSRYGIPFESFSPREEVNQEH